MSANLKLQKGDSVQTRAGVAAEVVDFLSNNRVLIKWPDGISDESFRQSVEYECDLTPLPPQ